MKDLIKLICLVGAVLILMIGYVYATATDPTGPASITRDQDERFDTSNWPAVQVSAEAGNVTKLTIVSLTQTQTWQGYYGDISGNITLDDASNNTMYSWELASPEGEIYASNSSSVTWSKIMCLNYTSDGRVGPNLTTIENMFGLAADDVDGVNETFDVNGFLSDGATPHPVVYVGTNTITAGTCPAADTFESDASAGTNFAEILLTDNVSIIFTTIIENNRTGFDSSAHDFQMLVGDDGHDGNDEVTLYYFFVELE